MKALVLGGGGAFGAYEAGVATALLRREKYDLVCGVSIGAINAALIVAGNDDALERFWYDVLPERSPQLFPHVARLRRLLERVGSIGHGGPWQNTMNVARLASEFPLVRTLGNFQKTNLPAIAAVLDEMVDYDARRCSLLACATNLTHGSAAVFRAVLDRYHMEPRKRARLIENRELDAGNFVYGLLASAAMPGLFPPIELTFDGETSLYADGAVAHNSPLGIAIENGATDVTVVFNDPEPVAGAPDATLGVAQVAFQIAILWQQRLLDYEMRLAEATNEIVRLGGAPGMQQITIRSVRPDLPLSIDMLAFDDAKAIAATFQRGVTDGSQPPKVSLPGYPAPVEKPSFLARLVKRRSTGLEPVKRIW
jgi:predicted acylesterase/phospholipase RssA